MHKEKIIIIDGMPCIVTNMGRSLKLGEGSGSRLGEQVGRKDSTQIQREKTKKNMKQLLEEIRKYGW